MSELITRTSLNSDLEKLQGVGPHEPVWSDVDCPTSGSAPCGPHPDVLACVECADDWPCATASAVADELDRLVNDTDWAWAVASSLSRRAAELRGVTPG